MAYKVDQWGIEYFKTQKSLGISLFANDNCSSFSEPLQEVK